MHSEYTFCGLQNCQNWLDLVENEVWYEQEGHPEGGGEGVPAPGHLHRPTQGQKGVHPLQVRPIFKGTVSEMNNYWGC
jgi:hypothetical protein